MGEENGTSGAVQAPAEGLISHALREGWEAFKRDPVVLVGFFVLKALFVGLSTWVLSGGFFFHSMHHHGFEYLEDLRSMVVASLSGMIDGLLEVGLLYAALLIVRRQPSPFGTLFSGFKKFVPVVIAGIVIKLIVGFGIMIFIIPGIFLAIALSQWAFLIMDRNAGALSAFEWSWQIMRGHKIDCFLMWLVLIPINIIGLIPLGLGLFITVPYTYAVQAAFYNRLAQLHPEVGSVNSFATPAP